MGCRADVSSSRCGSGQASKRAGLVPSPVAVVCSGLTQAATCSYLSHPKRLSSRRMAYRGRSVSGLLPALVTA